MRDKEKKLEKKKKKKIFTIVNSIRELWVKTLSRMKISSLRKFVRKMTILQIFQRI